MVILEAVGPDPTVGPTQSFRSCPTHFTASAAPGIRRFGSAAPDLHADFLLHAPLEAHLDRVPPALLDAGRFEVKVGLA